MSATPSLPVTPGPRPNMSKVSTESVERASPMAGLPPISVVALDLGAPVIKNGRCAAWYRGGNNPRSLKLDDAKGCWYDFGAGEGDGVIALVVKALKCDRREAVAWLHQNYRLASPDAAVRQRRQQVASEADTLAAWRWRLAQCLRVVRNSGWTAWHDAEQLYRGPQRARDLPASEWRALTQRLKIADRLDSYIKYLVDLPAADLLALRDRIEGPRAS